MIKLIPTKHLLLIAVVCVLLAIVLIAIPADEATDETPISIHANLQLVDQSQVMLTELQELTPKSNIMPSISTSGIVSGYDVPTPDNLVKKNSAPTFKDHSVTVKSGDSLSKVLSSRGISPQDIYKVSQADKKQKSLVRMLPGQTLNFTTNEKSGELTKLTLIQNRLDSVIFEREENKFTRTTESRTPEIVQTYKEAEINNSLFVDGLKAGISEPLIIEIANIFGWDIDFALDIRKGDSLSVLYEEKFLDGEKIGNGNIIAAQFINNGRTFQAIRFQTKKGAHYYTPDGLAMRKAFIRTPVDFSRISSKFNPNRLHPIFKTSRPHRGVDYAASSGTPVKAAGDGKISFAGKQNGYGNVVIIDHGRGYQTLYAHLRGFARGTKRGARVKQGKIIAYVGQTGWATGPHLHYEFRINGVHKNPVTVKLPNDDPMPKSDLKKYLPYAQKVVATLTNSHSPAFARKLAALKR
ncbi:peptidoglycan DD-metalloendopeptidase family protein [Marinomonas aquiplantarum]|uniref:Murein DD-endopeptidase MepM/ murein hydrolase activator NlpD n=1 Tax=Marinomonas aquiplantarum TaxID=491951 RepID=A0A366CSS3_9GAMM|nr:peptidoglycan DD-metalloendopeptidase family protein [Marinomonas aquiplantarum]RBO78402.1 murein DD-endopeptidase MepM/ murein hydrolase activator NlpD [Marinomonas aquiplantarum]